MSVSLTSSSDADALAANNGGKLSSFVDRTFPGLLLSTGGSWLGQGQHVNDTMHEYTISPAGLIMLGSDAQLTSSAGKSRAVFELDKSTAGGVVVGSEGFPEGNEPLVAFGQAGLSDQDAIITLFQPDTDAGEADEDGIPIIVHDFQPSQYTLRVPYSETDIRWDDHGLIRYLDVYNNHTGEISTLTYTHQGTKHLVKILNLAHMDIRRQVGSKSGTGLALSLPMLSERYGKPAGRQVLTVCSGQEGEEGEDKEGSHMRLAY